MKTFLVAFSLFVLTACGTSGAENATGGALTGPTITVNCQVTTSGGGTQGDISVNTKCPRDSFNPLDTDKVQ